MRELNISPLDALRLVSLFDALPVVNDLEWKEIYSLPYCVALDTKSCEFQYKLLFNNRCLVTYSFLCVIGIVSSLACSLIFLEHFFMTCHYSKNFWAEVKWFDDREVKIEHLSGKDIVTVWYSKV